MRSATSCFNKTLIRTDVKRFWPLLFLYTAVWIILLPVYQWVDQGLRFGNPGFYPGDYLYDMMFAGLIMAVIFGGLQAAEDHSHDQTGKHHIVEIVAGIETGVAKPEALIHPLVHRQQNDPHSGVEEQQRPEPLYVGSDQRFVKARCRGPHSQHLPSRR